MIDKRDHLDTLAVGDRLVWPHGGIEISGTITGIQEIHTMPGPGGRPVFTGITVLVEVRNGRGYDRDGWPTASPQTLTTTLQYANDVFYAYTPLRHRPPSSRRFGAELTEEGWYWCVSELTAGPPADLAEITDPDERAFGHVLYELLATLARYLEARDLSLAEFVTTALGELPSA